MDLPPKNHIASFDVDAQNTFTPLCPEELPVPEGYAIVTELNRQAGLAKYRLGSKDAHSPRAEWVSDEQHPPFTPLAKNNADCYWPAHAVPGTKGFDLIEGLPPVTHYDYFVWKGVELDMHPYGACYHDLQQRLSTGVIEFLQQKQVSTVIVGGLALDYCVKTTALQLIDAGFTIIVNLAATRGLTLESSQQAQQEMRAAGIILIDEISSL